MSNQEKMWYSIKEACDYLNINENVLYRKMILYNFESRTLPGEKGQFIAKEDVEQVQRGMHPRSPGGVTRVLPCTGIPGLVKRREEGETMTPGRSPSTFHDLYMRYELYSSDRMDRVIADAGVERRVLYRMFLGDPVARTDAEKVLHALSAYVNWEYTLENTDIPLLNE